MEADIRECIARVLSQLEAPGLHLIKRDVQELTDLIETAGFLRRTGFVNIKRPKLLVVEGDDEVFLFQAFLRDLGLSDVQIVPAGSKDKVRPILKVIARAPGFIDTVQALGVVRDADADADATFRSIRDGLKEAGLQPLPSKPCEPTTGAPRVSVMVLPGEGHPGMLESLCLASVREDPAMVCVDGFFNCLAQKGAAPPRNMAKARAHTFLSSRQDPARRLGEAVQRNYFPRNAAAFEGLRQFLTDLFG